MFVCRRSRLRRLFRIDVATRVVRKRFNGDVVCRTTLRQSIRSSHMYVTILVVIARSRIGSTCSSIRKLSIVFSSDSVLVCRSLQCSVVIVLSGVSLRMWKIKGPYTSVNVL